MTAKKKNDAFHQVMNLFISNPSAGTDFIPIGIIRSKGKKYSAELNINETSQYTNHNRYNNNVDT